MSEDEDTIVGMYEVLEALEDLIKTAAPEKKAALAEAIEGYSNSFPDEFYWAVGAQAPTLLSNLMMAIDLSSTANPQTKSTPPIVSADRRPRSRS